MALSNIRREPRREITEQIAGLIFMMAYAGWVAFSVHLSMEWHHPVYCYEYKDAVCVNIVSGYWADPGDILITIGLMIAVWLIYPFLLLMHAFGEMVCNWMCAIGIDPRPKNRY